MIFKKVEIYIKNSTEIVVLENIKVWFSTIAGSDIYLYIGELEFDNITLKKGFWIPDNLITFETIEDLKDKDRVIFKIKAYL